MKSIIVVGLQGCGKTKHSENIKDYFGLTSVFDSWDGAAELPESMMTDTLILTNISPGEIRVPGLKVYSFDRVIADMSLPGCA